MVPGEIISNTPTLGASSGEAGFAVNNHSDDRRLREAWGYWTTTPVDVIRNAQTGVTHLAISHQNSTLCGIVGVRRVQGHLMTLIKQVQMEKATPEATCHICQRRSSHAPL